MDNLYQLNKLEQRLLLGIKGPIAIFGAGGFIGLNLLKSILLYRSDVYGISQDYTNNWRFTASQIPYSNLLNCDLNEITQIHDLVNSLKPRTIFNLAAYGAYSKQKEYKKIYKTNVSSTIDLIEALKKRGFDAYIHAGSQSEYGTNSKKPREDSELIPNSHYAVSKIANYYTVKYYGKVEHLPTIHLRLYSAFGPWEEPDRLIPVLVSRARNGKFPKFVDADISRDFIYIHDVVRAFIISAAKIKKTIFGEAFNVATGEKTTMKELALNVGKMLHVLKKPEFGAMTNRDWDLKDWYGNTNKIEKILGWKAKASLREGILKTVKWQEEIGYDSASWNWTRENTL